MQVEFTAADVNEARRANRWLARAPRLRMTSTAGRWGWNLALRVAELWPARRRDTRLDRRTIEAGGRQVAVRVIRRKAGPVAGLVVEFHGGGWTIGNARMSDSRNIEIARKTGLAIVSVDYRLAVHHTIAEQVDDCEAALVWAIGKGRREFGTEAVLVQGESAGAHLAALAMLRLRDAGNAASLAGALLVFGLYDFAGSDAVRSAGDDLLVLDGPTILHVLRDVTPGRSDAERRSADLSPLHADLSGLPPALFIVGTRDALREENEAMERRWRASNGNSAIIVAPESPHAFIRLPTRIARKVRRAMREWLMECAT